MYMYIYISKKNKYITIKRKTATTEKKKKTERIFAQIGSQEILLNKEICKKR